MTDRKQIKKEKQQLILKLSNLYGEHEDNTDHVAGEDSTCTLCQDIQAWKAIITKLDAQLQEIDKAIAEANKPKKKVKLPKEPKILKTQIPIDSQAEENWQKMLQKKAQMVQDAKYKIFHVQLEGEEEHFYRVTARKKVFDTLQEQGYEVRPANVTLIPREDYTTTYMERGEGKHVSLAILDKEEIEGLLGKTGLPEKAYVTSFNCQRKVQETAILYDGENYENVQNFCLPATAAKTKKGNKMQINTHRGSLSVSPSHFIVKYGARLEIYTEEEFLEMYNESANSEQIIWLTND